MNEQKTINVVVVDDHPFMRGGVAAILRSQSDMSVVDEAGTAAEAIAAYLRHVPDLVVIDLGLPDDSGLNAAAPGPAPQYQPILPVQIRICCLGPDSGRRRRRVRRRGPWRRRRRRSPK